jgi:hypothetical protein
MRLVTALQLYMELDAFDAICGCLMSQANAKTILQGNTKGGGGTVSHIGSFELAEGRPTG